MKLLFFCMLISFNLVANTEDPVVAEVNGVSIKKSVLEQTYFQDMLYVSDQIVTPEKVLYDLINRELGIQNAKKVNLQNDPIVKYKMEDVLYHAKVSNDLEVEFKKIEVSDKEVKNYYSEYPEYRTAHILFRMTVKPTKAQDEEAIKMALKVYKTVKAKPETFAELANKYSQASVAPNGGDLDYQPAIRLAPEYFMAIKNKPVGYITPPVRTQFGYHIIKIMGVKKFEEVNKTFYQKVVYDQKRDKIMADYFEKQRKNAKIKINKEFLK